MNHHESLRTLPPSGFVRLPDLIGAAAVTPEQAEANRRAGKGPRRPRPGRAAVVPFSSATLWRKVKAGEFPRPVKLSDRVTAWSVESVRTWMQQHAA